MFHIKEKEYIYIYILISKKELEGRLNLIEEEESPSFRNGRSRRHGRHRRRQKRVASTYPISMHQKPTVIFQHKNLYVHANRF